MRRALSIALYIFGGWMLGSEMAIAFLSAGPDSGMALAIAIFAVVAGVPLLLGAWASPGFRWQELGLTMLLAVGVVLFCGIGAAAVFLDPGAKPFMQPMPKLQLAPAFGAANLLVVAAAGWLLYRHGRPAGEN